jgi:hypothetical protein
MPASGLPSQSPANLEAVEPWQHNVEDDQIGTKCTDLASSFEALGRCGNSILALAVQAAFDKVNEGRLVIHYQNAPSFLCLSEATFVYENAGPNRSFAFSLVSFHMFRNRKIVPFSLGSSYGKMSYDCGGAVYVTKDTLCWHPGWICGANVV